MADTVYVALNHPQGITFLLDEGKTRVTIEGNAANLKGKEGGVLPVGGYGLTEVDRALWERVKATYGHLPIFRHGLIFAQDSADKAKDEAKEKKETRHGREPVAIDGSDKTVKTQAAKA